MFLAMAQDDCLVGSGVRGFYDQLFAAGYRPELHLFRSGGHGLGLAPRGRSSDQWSSALAAWLLDLGPLPLSLPPDEPGTSAAASVAGPSPASPNARSPRAEALRRGLGRPDEGRAGAARRPRVIRSCSGPGHPRCGLPAS